MKFHPRHALLLLCGLLLVSLTTACDDDDSYADRRKRERNQISNFIKRGTCQFDENGDTLLYVAPIKVISEAEFAAQDSTTDVSKNEYVYLSGTGIYMQILSKGTGEKLSDGETATVLARYTELNIGGDSIQSTNNINAYANEYEVMTCSNSDGLFSGMFVSGLMKSLYNSTSVPSGWLVPLNYIKLGRADGSALPAKVRLILPSTEGQQTALADVYACFYEIKYLKGR